MPKVRTDDGVEIHYHQDDFRDPWTTGPGETVVMSHGFARSMKWWIQWVPALARRYRVLRYDVRGCGQSSVPPAGAIWSAERIAGDVRNLVDHLGIPKIHWVGFESGGLWGMVFAVNHPDRIKSLTVINTPFGHEGGGLSSAADTVEKVGLKQFLTDTNPGRLDMNVADPKLVEWHIAEHSKTPVQVATSIMRTVDKIDVSQLLPKIQVPTLIMVGDSHPGGGQSLDAQRAMAQQIPKGRLAVFSGIGPGIHLLIPDRCIEAQLRFLDEVSAA